MANKEGNVIRLHLLKLHESPILPEPDNDDNDFGDFDAYERFHMIWIVDDENGSSEPTPEDAASSKTWEGITEGDLVAIPELLSGSGEFESLRFAGARREGGGIPLLEGGIESPEIPSVIFSLAEQKGFSLREMYERPIESFLDEQGFSLADVFGADEDVDEFWENPHVARRTGPPTDDTWQIPLRQCTWLNTVSFAVGVGAVGGGGEL
uniref:Uncharacterized protein n=1 Tax=Helicotheca tamesis TaxID=374047 RepID=A0A7S2HK88_9STRA|mmetsp:Transcript_18876/g.25966  ORF Transcript_18876/g.25966 Transcript_18876/m.25966 type:complete len:209 (+) Transcript_18876:64-690(+)